MPNKLHEQHSISHMKNTHITVVTTDFTTHGRSHIYGLPYPYADALDPMDHFCTFDVSKIISKNTHYLLYATFKPVGKIHFEILRQKLGVVENPFLH